MIPSSTVGMLALAAVLTFLAPIVVLAVLCVRRVIAPKPMWFGVLAFFVSQVCLRLPILSALAKQSRVQAFASQNKVVYALIVAFSAGLFEETARYFGARFCLKPAERRYRDAAAFGLGHGFCECVLIVGLGELSNLAACAALNSGALSAATPAGAQAAAALAKVTAPLVLMAVWERVSTVMFHFAATVFVFRSVRERKLGWYLLALAAHTVTDFFPALIPASSALLTELLLFAVSLLLLFLAVRMKPKFRDARPIAA